MKFSYYEETDTLYIDLSSRTSAEAEEVAPDIVIDFDSEGMPVGIEIEHASQKVDLSRIETESLPAKVLVLSQR